MAQAKRMSSARALAITAGVLINRLSFRMRGFLSDDRGKLE
jgi:hypothetical protein